MSDRVQKMLEKQKEREEAMKKKEAERTAEEQAKKSELNQAAIAKVAPSAKKSEAPATPQDTWFTMKKTIYGPLPPTSRGRPTLLGGDPQGENIVYCLGNSVIIRSLKNPIECDVYSEHNYPTTVARYSPDRKFIASGDQSGAVRVWHTEIIQGTVHKLKMEKKALGGPIMDIDWDNESKRILAVGQGRDKFGVLFFAETGAGAGDITGHSKTITCCALRQHKPYRIATGGEDFLVNWFEGPPFKWKHYVHQFGNFINCIKYSPDGKVLLVVTQDKKGVFVDGESGEKKHELSQENGHTGGIYSCSWSPDGSQVLTVSGDKTAKIWDASNGKCLQTFSFGTETEDQLLGCIWQGEFLVALNLAGHLIYLDRNNPGTPLRILKGHNKTIEALVYDSANNVFFSGSYDTIMIKWNVATGETVGFKGKGHKNAIKKLAIQGSNLVSIAQDDTLRITPLATLQYSDSFVKLDGPPVGVGVGKRDTSLIVTASNNSVFILRNGAIASTLSVAYNPQAVALSVDETQVAVGGENQNIHLYKINGNNLVEDGVLKGHRGVLTRVEYSPDGTMLASADRNREVIIWDLASKSIKVNNLVFHTARVDGLGWNPNCKYVVTGGLDQTIIVWSIDDPSKRITIKGAHHGGINETIWLNNSTVASTGQDCTIRTWTVL